jgi:signal transduction histidine kinase
LLADDHDSTLVQVEGVLVSQRRALNDEVLEMQAGVIAFEARLAGRPPLSKIPAGSRLRLTGVLAGQGASRIAGGHLASVDLLLNSPADIQVVAQPPWWTAGRLLALSAVLAGVLALATVWISLLRREVDRRTDQLEKQIRSREHAERQQALEAERARIARDLHDDLGSSMTEISMLAETGRDQSPASLAPRERFDRILGRARNSVLKLDEIVWAVDPRKDTLRALVGYLSGFAEEYVSAAGLTCRVELPQSVPEMPLEARIRHQLFLSVKEALNNAVRHAHASQVRFSIRQSGPDLTISIGDNGRGFEAAAPTEGNGLRNLHTRLASLGGRCEIQSRPGEGTTIVLALSLAKGSYSL